MSTLTPTRPEFERQLPPLPPHSAEQPLALGARLWQRDGLRQLLVLALLALLLALLLLLLLLVLALLALLALLAALLALLLVLLLSFLGHCEPPVFGQPVLAC